MTLPRLGLLAILVGTGCGARAIEVDPQAALLVGTWTNQTQTQVFDEHGTLTVNDTLLPTAAAQLIDPQGNPSGTFFTGSFTTAAGPLSATGYSGLYERAYGEIASQIDFQIVGDVLGERLLRPTTPLDGFVGSWHARWTTTFEFDAALGGSQTFATELTLVLEADHTATESMTATSNMSPAETCTGTWTATAVGPSLSWDPSCAPAMDLVAPTDSPVYQQLAPGVLALDTLERAKSI